MKKLIQITLVIILFSLIIVTVPNALIRDKDDFSVIENELIKEEKFTQNGIKLKYSVDRAIQDEYLDIKEKLNDIFKEDIKETENNISLKDEYKEIKVSLWKQEDKTNVEIIYLNESLDKNTSQIKNYLEKIRNLKAYDLKYFNFVKVKIINNDKEFLKDIIKQNVKLNSLNTVDIYNGFVTKGELNNSENISFAFIEYDEQEYLIVGTPVIFLTY